VGCAPLGYFTFAVGYIAILFSLKSLYLQPMPVDRATPSFLPGSFVLIFLLIVWTAPGNAQRISERDSLITIYSSATPRDSTMVKVMCRLSQIYRLSSPDSAIAFSKEAYTLAEKISYQSGIATSLNVIGTVYFFQGNYPMAQEYQQKALDYAQAHQLRAAYANALNSLALAHQYQGNFVAAYEAYLKALKIEEERKNYPGLVKVLTNIGILYKNQEDFGNALPYYLRSLALTDSLKDPRLAKANIYNNIGVLYMEQRRFKEALEYFRNSLTLNEKLGNRVFVATCFSNIGYCYLQMDSATLAERYLDKSIALARELNLSEGLGKALLNIAGVYLKQGQPRAALAVSKESLAISKKFNNKENIFLNYKGLAEIYKQLRQPALASEYWEKALTLGDSLRNTSNSKKISALQKSFELNKKESEIKLLEKEAALEKAARGEERSLRYGLIGLIAGLCIVAGIAYYSFSIKASLNKQLQKQNEEISRQKQMIERINKDLKAQALRAQMNPHFIFNSLNSIQYLILQQESKKAFDYLAKFSMLLRRVMDNSERNLIALSEEIEILNLYLELESLRFDSAFDYRIESLIENSNSVKVPPLVLQPYIENAIQHGLMPKADDRKLTVQFSREGNGVCCEIRDNGIGRAEALEISKKKNKIFASKGMNYTAERIEVMNKIFDGKSEVQISDLTENGKASGTMVKISFAYA
jgi:tetratricopeptide (TPR) repeat protein